MISVDDLTVLLVLLTIMSALLGLVGWITDRICDAIDARRYPAPLTRDQLADRGAPTYWADVFPIDDEGEVAP